MLSLGKTSTTNKRYRLLKELQSHMTLQISANKSEVGLDYLPMLKTKLTQPLINNGAVCITHVRVVICVGVCGCAFMRVCMHGACTQDFA